MVLNKRLPGTTARDVLSIGSARKLFIRLPGRQT
jgi:hypothetical protein